MPTDDSLPLETLTPERWKMITFWEDVEGVGDDVHDLQREVLAQIAKRREAEQALKKHRHDADVDDRRRIAQQGLDHIARTVEWSIAHVAAIERDRQQARAEAAEARVRTLEQEKAQARADMESLSVAWDAWTDSLAVAPSVELITAIDKLVLAQTAPPHA